MLNQIIIRNCYCHLQPKEHLEYLSQLMSKMYNLGKALIHIEKDKIVHSVPKIVADLFNKYFASIAKVISEQLYHSFPGSDWEQFEQLLSLRLNYHQLQWMRLENNSLH